MFFVLFVFILCYVFSWDKKTERKQKKHRTQNRKTKKIPVQMPEKTKHRMKTNKTKNITQNPKRLPVQMPGKTNTE
jgi:Flp pilus assembly protein TadB